MRKTLRYSLDRGNFIHVSAGKYMLIVNNGNMRSVGCMYSKLAKKACSRRSHRRCSVKTGVLKNFAKCSEKHLCWRNLFLTKL